MGGPSGHLAVLFTSTTQSTRRILPLFCCKLTVAVTPGRWPWGLDGEWLALCIPCRRPLTLHPSPWTSALGRWADSTRPLPEHGPMLRGHPFLQPAGSLLARYLRRAQSTIHTLLHMPLRCSVDAHVLTDAIPTSVRVLLPPRFLDCFSCTKMRSAI
jgi:hypothetical protein